MKKPNCSLPREQSVAANAHWFQLRTILHKPQLAREISIYLNQSGGASKSTGAVSGRLSFSRQLDLNRFVFRVRTRQNFPQSRHQPGCSICEIIQLNRSVTIGRARTWTARHLRCARNRDAATPDCCQQLPRPSRIGCIEVAWKWTHLHLLICPRKLATLQPVPRVGECPDGITSEPHGTTKNFLNFNYW